MNVQKFFAGIASLALCFSLLPAAASTPNRRHQTQSSTHAVDQQIARYLKGEYAKKKDLSGIIVHVGDRVVTLTGSVDSYRALLNAEHIARQVESVNGVIDEVRVAGPTVPDSRLQTSISQRLTYDRIGQGQTFNNLTISVHQGVVTLGGQVLDYPDRDSALAIASDTKGVKRVIDHIQVEPLSPFDNQIRFEAARAIYGNPSLRQYALNPAHPIRIIVHNGHVTLDGVVQSQVDKQLAQSSLAGINGIFSVKNNLVVAK